ALRSSLGEGRSLEEAIVRTYLQFLATHPDSLIARKRGEEAAREVSERAKRVAEGKLRRDEFDGWLREGGHGRNPGTTAHLLAAALFVALREGSLSPHERFAG